MEQLLLDVQARLAAEVTALKYIDQDWGQLDYYNPNPPVKWPTALVEFDNAQWTNTGKLIQLGVASIRIRTADIRLVPSSAKASPLQKDLSMALVRITQDIHKALHGWTGHDSYTALIRTATRKLKRDDGLQLFDIMFTTEITDASAVVVPPPAPVFKGVDLRLP